MGTTATLSEDTNGAPASPVPSRNPQPPASPMPGGKPVDRVVLGSPARKRLLLRKDVDESGEDDAGEESDPEDSETLWICTLKIHRVGGDASSNLSRTSSSMNGHENGYSKAASNSNVGTGILRLKVGVLSSTPHHPKVVAMLEVPFPLPDENGGGGAPWGGCTCQADLRWVDAHGGGDQGCGVWYRSVVGCSRGFWRVHRKGGGLERK